MIYVFLLVQHFARGLSKCGFEEKKEESTNVKHL